MKGLDAISTWTTEAIENTFKETAASLQLKPGDVQLPFRIMLVGGKYGPAVYEISNIIGKDATMRRIQNGLGQFNQ